MNKEQVINAVKNYICDDYSKYALLINGPWGCGKTYLYERRLIDEIDKLGSNNHKRTNIYISLYGISSLEDLSKEILTSFIVNSKCKDNREIKKIIKSADGVLSLFSKSLSFSIGPVSVNINDILRDIGKMIKTKNTVICFDDFERCSLPINEIMGFINNLVEHCNCKVLILSDEDNIGKTFANTNVEQKYLSILTGGRRVDIERRVNRDNSNSCDEISMDRLKEISEELYSENYIYHDIKEKVIGKTLLYTPDIKEIIRTLVDGGDNHASIERDSYETFILNHLDRISLFFTNTFNRNVRTVISWLVLFRKIHDTSFKKCGRSKYYDLILLDFAEYSIWAIVASKTNLRIVGTANQGGIEIVYYKSNQYTGVKRFRFIDAYIRSENLNADELGEAFRVLEEKYKYNDLFQRKPMGSEGVALSELSGWYLMEDKEVGNCIDKMIDELQEGKYIYADYSSILKYLIVFHRIGLYKGDIADVRDCMIKLIEKDLEVQEEREFPVSFDSEEDIKRYNEVYDIISSKRTKRNHELGKEDMERNHIYDNASTFLSECKLKRDYYTDYKSFMEFIDKEKIIVLINNSNNEGIYSIKEAFNKVYYMGNAKEFFEVDKEPLQELVSDLRDKNKVDSSGITRKYAIDNLALSIERIISKL